MADEDQAASLLMLRRAATSDQRAEAIAAALDAGVPLARIETLLDWLDAQLDNVDQPFQEP
jgi:hypothetical protein